MIIRRIGECSAHAARRATAMATAAAAPSRPVVRPLTRPGVHVARRPASSAASPTPVNDEGRGLNSRDIFDAKPSTTFLKAQLMKAMEDMNEARQNGSLDAHCITRLLHAANSLRAYPEILQPYLNAVVPVLSGWYITNRVSEEDLPALQAFFAHACLDPRVVAGQMQRASRNTIYKIAGWYADWLVAEARRASGPDDPRLNAILDVWEEQVRSLGDGGGSQRIVVPFVAAWAVLNARTGRTRPESIILTFPADSTITGWISHHGLADAAGGEDVNAAARKLCEEHFSSELPTTLEGLASRLFSLRNRGKIAQLVELWEAFAAELDGTSTHPLAVGDMRDKALAKVLAVVRSRSSQSASRTANERESLAKIEAEVRKRVPKPTPLPVLHALLNTAGPEDLEDGAGMPRDRAAIVAAAKEIWEAARDEGVVRDEQAYGIYIGILGRYHDGTELFKAWDELVADTACRELEAQKAAAAPPGKKGSKPQDKACKSKIKTLFSLPAWPSVRIFNQLLGATFSIGSQTALMGLALWRVAIDPKSPLTPDLITLNIALRYAGNCRDIKLMNEVISAAGPLGLVPDIITYTTLVQGLLRSGRPELARQTLDAMKQRGMEPNDRMAAMLVADLAAEGRSDGLTRAEDVIRHMRQRGIRTSVPMWTSLVAGYFRGGWDVDAWAALDRMRASGLRLNDVGYNVVLNQVLRGDSTEGGDARARRAFQSRERASRTGVALKVLDHMLENNVPPTTDTYAILLGAFLRADSVHALAHVLAVMDERQFKTNKGSLGDMIRSARKRVARGADRR